jgi:hypothetical protein
MENRAIYFEHKLYGIVFMLFVASIAAGFALKDVFEFSMIAGGGLGTIFLLCSAYFAGKCQTI